MIVSGYNDALAAVFLHMVPLIIVAAVLLCFVTEKPLATTIENNVVPVADAAELAPSLGGTARVPQGCAGH